MATIAVHCPDCGRDKIAKYGQTSDGKQRYYCENESCSRRTFILNYQQKARVAGVKEMIIDMTLNGSGIRDIARVLKISTTTVIKEIKKACQLRPVNQNVLEQIHSAGARVGLNCIKAAEIDEQWSFVAKKKRPRWLWHAIDHRSGKVLAYVLGRRQDKIFLKLKKLLKPFKIQRYYTDHYGSYERHLNSKQHYPSKRNTQKIEQKHIKFRTRIKRLARKTICFSKSPFMHDTVLGLFINRHEFKRNI